MKPFGHQFQRLPSEHELDFYRNPQSSNNYQNSPLTLPQVSSSLNGSKAQYQPVGGRGESVRAQSWTNSPTIKLLGFLSHLVLTLMPITFIVLAFLALSVDGEPVSPRGSTVFEAAKLGPSIFPIIFAAVVGRLMRTFALWRAERGSTIGLLEQLNGSQNLLAAVERTFLLSGLWSWGVIIILLWALSPLGGQSSLRVLELSQKGNQFNQTMKYFNTDNSSLSIFAGASSLDYGLPTVQAIYQACLLAPASITSSSADTWNNVKIPLMQAQPIYASNNPDWISIEHTNATVYSSLTGIVVAGLRSDTAANFTIESSYMNLTCPAPATFGSGDPDANFTSATAAFRQWMGNVLVHTNQSIDPFDHASGDVSAWNTFTVDTNFNFSLPGLPNTRQMSIIFASKNISSGYLITAYNCSVGATRVESMIGCNGTSCRVDKMRPSQIYTDSSISTPFNQDDSFVPVINLLNEFPWLTGSPHSGETSPADFYVSGVNTPYQPTGLDESADYTHVPPVQVAQRLGALLNTVWQSGIAQTAIASPPPDPASLQIPAPLSQQLFVRATMGIMQTDSIVYHANRLWVGFTATISLVLFICGVAGMTFRYITSAPDILGYVSTMTRDNPFFNDHRAAGADTLDGLERARLLKDAVVQITDVRPRQGGDGGHIALRSVVAGQSRKSFRLNRPLSSLQRGRPD